MKNQRNEYFHRLNLETYHGYALPVSKRNRIRLRFFKSKGKLERFLELYCKNFSLHRLIKTNLKEWFRFIESSTTDTLNSIS